MRFCDSYLIKLGNDSIEVSDDALYLGQDHGEEAIVPKGDGSAQVLTQISSFRNEFDDFQESSYETDCDAFVSFVVANTAKDPAHALKRLLPDFCGCPSLFGQSFSLTLDNNGKVESVATMTEGLDPLPA